MDKLYNEFFKHSKIQKRLIKRNNFTYRFIIREVEKILSEIKKDNVKILDYGCGVGTLAFYLASTKNNITGIDISPMSIKLCNRSAREMGLGERIRFIINTDFWRKLKNINNKFDLVICSEVIEHVRNDTKLLEKLSGVLNKKGYVLLTVPSKNAPLFRIGFAKSFDRKVGHLRRYDSSQLTQKLKNMNLRIVKVRKVEGILRNSLFLYSRLGWIIKFLKGPLSDVVTFFDNLLVELFGESNIYIVAKKL